MKHRVSTVAQNGQLKHWLIEDLLRFSTIADGHTRGVWLVAICNFTPAVDAT